MPSCGAHSKHIAEVLSIIKSKVKLNKWPTAYGPDPFMFEDYSLFLDRHRHNTRLYFSYLIDLIKRRNLQYNSKVMEFLYGELDHFVLDFVMHPLIYYMTEGLKWNYRLKPHTLVEMWIDEYVMLKAGGKQEDHCPSKFVMDEDTKSLINTVYSEVFKKPNIASKYERGVFFLTRFDKLRRTKNGIIIGLSSKLKIGDFFYHGDVSRVTKYLNLEHNGITNPVTGQIFTDSFDDLWNQSLKIAAKLITDVNGYLYDGKPLDNYYINNNISYNTGLPCCEDGEEKFEHVMRYDPNALL